MLLHRKQISQVREGSLSNNLSWGSWQGSYQYTVNEIIIATIKMRNNFCYPLKMVIFHHLVIPPNFAIAKVVDHNLFASIFVWVFLDWFMASFLYSFPYSCRSFTLLKKLAKCNTNLIANAFKSEKERERATTMKRKPSKKKQRTDTKRDAKRIKSVHYKEQ